MARPKRYDHCLCGRKRKLATNPGNGDPAPAYFATAFFPVNVTGSGSVCASAYTKRVDIKITHQESRIRPALCSNVSTGLNTYNHVWTLLTVEYDELKGVWYGETSTMPLESYGHTLCFELWHHGSNDAVQFWVEDGGEAITPIFGVSGGLSLGSPGSFAPVIYLKDDCTMSGEMAPYRDVLPKFLFGMPTSYNVTFDDDFVTGGEGGGSVGGSYIIQPGCYHNVFPCYDPIYSEGPDIPFTCRQLEPHACGVNWAGGWYYQSDDCCYYEPDGTLSWLGGSPSFVTIAFGENLYVSSTYLAYYQNIFATTDIYWQPITLSFAGGSPPGLWNEWTAPATISVAPVGFDAL